MAQEGSGFHFPLEILQCHWSDLYTYCEAKKVFMLDSCVELLSVANAVAQDESDYIHILVQEKKLWQAQPEENLPTQLCSFVIVQPYIFVSVYS